MTGAMMSGTNELGRTTTTNTDADIAALMAANVGDVSRDMSYEKTAGGFSDPGAAEEQTSASHHQDPEPQIEQVQVQEEAHTTILGRPPEVEAPVSEIVDPVQEAEAEADFDRDAIYQGLTASAQSERAARQQIQQALAERDSELAEARQFRERYEPHIAELSDLWPEIEEQTKTLANSQSAEALSSQKLELYRNAALEAGLEIDESRIDLAATLEGLRKSQAALPDLIDARLARVINNKSESYDHAQAQADQAASHNRAVAERNTYVANKLDGYYKDNPDMKEFETWISSEVEKDPNVDMSLVAAPFSKMVSSRRAVTRAGRSAEVSVGTGSEVGQVASADQDASSQPDMGADYANMSIDEQIAKVRASGMFGR